jgi:hypothetical protein
MAIARRWASLDVEGLFAAASTSREHGALRILTAVAARELVRLDPRPALANCPRVWAPAQRRSCLAGSSSDGCFRTTTRRAQERSFSNDRTLPTMSNCSPSSYAVGHSAILGRH